MQAIQVQNPGQNSTLSIEEVPTPQPKANEILVNVKATALNRADLNQRSGNYPPPEGASDILGLEMTGIVEKTGTKVTHCKPGDAVCALLPGGGYAEYAVVPEQMAMPVPENVSLEEAAAIPETFLTAFQALSWVCDLQQGETVLVHAGGSGVGTAAIQLARQLFEARIATTASQQPKLATCAELGADLTINYKTQDFADIIAEEWGETAVDVIIDFIGAPYWKPNIDVLNTDGRMVYLSFLGGNKLENMSLAPLLKKRLSVTGSTLRSRDSSYKIKLTQDFYEQTHALFESETIAPVIDKVFDWQNTDEAHGYMADNKNTGKIVLTGM